MTHSPTCDALAEALRPLVCELDNTFRTDERDHLLISVRDLRRARTALVEYEAEMKGDPFASVDAYLKRNERIVARIMAHWTEEQREHMRRLGEPQK